MQPLTFFRNFPVLLFGALLAQNAGSVCASRKPPGVVVVGENTASNAVETCTNFMVSTQSHNLSQEWRIENLADRLNMSNGNPEDLETLQVVNVYGRNWSFVLTGSRGDEMMIEYNTTVSPLDPDQPNSIIGQAILQGLNFSKEFICIDPFPLKSGLTGRCYALLRKTDQAGLVQSDFITVSIKLSLLYADFSHINATGVHCDELRLEAFKSTQDPAEAGNSNSTLLIPAIVSELNEQYAKVWKHRIGVRWSIPNVSQYLEGNIRLWSVRKLAKLLLAKETVETDWEIHIELQQRLETKVIRTTVISLGHNCAVRLLNVTRAEVGFSDGEKQVEVVPLDETRGSSWYFWLSSEITDVELAKLANGVVVLLEYDVIYGLRQKNVEPTTHNRHFVDSRR